MCTGFGGHIMGWTQLHPYLWSVVMLQDFMVSARLFAIYFLSVSAMGMLFVPIGKFGRLASSARQYCTIKKYSQLAVVTHVQHSTSTSF